MKKKPTHSCSSNGQINENLKCRFSCKEDKSLCGISDSRVSCVYKTKLKRNGDKDG